MNKLNGATFTGFLLCFMAIVFGIMTNGGIASVMNIIHIPSFIITFGGSLFATLMTADSFADFYEGLKSFATAFKKQTISIYNLAEEIFQLSETGRKEGLLALDEVANKIEFDFLKKAITCVVDGSDPELVRGILENEMNHKEERNRKNITFWQDLGAYAPAWGMLGTLLGLIDMMKSMGTNLDAIGAGMALALITTLYGSVLANWICIPLSRKLEKSSNEEMLIMEIVIEGVLSIQAGENTRIIREKIKSIIEMDMRE